GKFVLITMATELEAGLISERTKAALKAAKARGVKLAGMVPRGIRQSPLDQLSPADRGAGRADIGHDNASKAGRVEARRNKIRLELGIAWYAVRSNRFPERIAFDPSRT